MKKQTTARGVLVVLILALLLLFVQSTQAQYVKKMRGNYEITNSLIIDDSLSINGSAYVDTIADFNDIVIGKHMVNIFNVSNSIYSLQEADYILSVSATVSSAVTITLPTAQVESGRIIVIKDSGGGAASNNITIQTEGSETIDGAATYVLTTAYESVQLYCDGSNWYLY